jgi:trimethylamine--corrinoid protein Co-methyltransferase
MERYENAFYAPLLSNWDNYGSWLVAGSGSGSVNTEQRANQIWKQLLQKYQQPAVDPGIDEALQDYMSRRKLKIAAAD